MPDMVYNLKPRIWRCADFMEIAGDVVRVGPNEVRILILFCLCLGVIPEVFQLITIEASLRGPKSIP